MSVKGTSVSPSIGAGSAHSGTSASRLVAASPRFRVSLRLIRSGMARTPSVFELNTLAEARGRWCLDVTGLYQPYQRLWFHRPAPRNLPPLKIAYNGRVPPAMNTPERSAD